MCVRYMYEDNAFSLQLIILIISEPNRNDVRELIGADMSDWSTNAQCILG